MRSRPFDIDTTVTPVASCGVEKDECNADLEVFRFGCPADGVEQLSSADLGIKTDTACGVEKESCFLVGVIGFHSSSTCTELSDDIFDDKRFDG